MKKTVSLLLTALLIIAFAIVPASAENQGCDLCIAVASDLHYNQPDEFTNLIDDEVYFYANRRAAMENESGFIIDEFLRQCAQSDVEYVLISGDLADNGRTDTDEHFIVAQKLRDFEAETGKSVFVINGNHDLGNGSNTDTAEFKNIYSEFGYDKAIETVAEDCSYTANLGEKYRLIALDSCDADESTADGMTLTKINWVIRQAENAYKDGRYPILMMHHNLLDHMPMQRIFSKNFIVKFHYSTAELFANAGIRTVLTGHEHCGDAASYTSGLGNEIYDFATTSLTMYPLQYRTFTFTDNEIEYKTQTVDKIDTAALKSACSEYTNKQLELMNKGLNEYAKGFLKAGVQYRLELSLTMEKMGIKETDVYYNLINTAVSELVTDLRMPLYGENSLSSKAAEYNINLPQTDYSTGWDLATDLVAAHYAGDESFALESAEVELLLKAVALILRDDLATVNDEVLLSGANALLSNFGIYSITQDMSKAAASVFGGVHPFEYFVVALVSPILYEFAFDTDGVNDCDGTLTGYGTVSAVQKVNSLTEKYKELFDTLLVYIKNYFTYIMKLFVK